MKIVLIGAGNVASPLAVKLKESGHEISQVYSRAFDNADSLAKRVGAAPTDNIADLFCDADLYIFSVKDDALPEIVRQMPVTTGIWAHTAGSVPISALLPKEERGVIYPLQTFSKDREVNFREIPLFIEGSSAQTTDKLKELAATISDRVSLLSGEKRAFLHLAAVFACNFTNHMYTLASEILEENEMPFHLLIPLITETASKVSVKNPKEAQTGPAVRFDQKVMQKQINLLNNPLKKEIYSLISNSIHITSLA